MPNFLRKLFGFAVGAGGCFYLLVSVFESARLVPKGAGWFFIIVFFGVLGARLASAPRQAIERIKDVNQPLSKKWWGLDKGLRFSVFVAVLWIVGVYVWIDEYDRTFANTFAPALMVLGVYFGYLLFVKDPAPRGSIATSMSNFDVVEELHVRDPDGLNEVTPSDVKTSKDREREMNDLINRMK